MKERKSLNSSDKELERSVNLVSAFSQINRELHSAYKNLEKRFEELNLKLERTNLELRQSLAEKEKISIHLNNIVESLNSGVLAIDLDGRINLFNKAAEAILGYAADEVIGKSYVELFGGEEEEKFALPFVLKHHQLCLNEEKQVRCKNGERITICFSTSFLKNTQGELWGAVEVFSGLTSLKKMEEEIMQVRTLATLGEMAAVVAHEVKNPLGGIRGFAELLQRNLAESDPKRKWTEKIIEGVDALDGMVKNLLEYTKPVKLNAQKVNVNSLIDETINFFEMDSSQKRTNVHMVKSYPQETLCCHLDTEQFRQILLNLLHNAVQAMPKGGVVTVELNQEKVRSDLDPQAKEGKIILKISDTGTGMNQETQKKLFTPFFTTKEGGTGLGLSTVKRIVEAHRGEIQVESQEGKGTTVVVRLPKSSSFYQG